jgi:cytochrome c oxidase subunit 2
MRRGWRLALLATAALVVTACGNSSSPSALDTEGPAARRIAGVWWLMFGLASVVYLIVAGFIIVAALRGRNAGPEGKTSRISDNAFIVGGGLIVPVVILALLAVVTVKTTDALSSPSANALRVEVEGFRWWWGVRYPEARVTTANEIRIPVGRPVALELITEDVIHSVWVPQLAGKMDMIPGQRNVLRIQADKPGVYRGQCAEYCGLQHAKMALLVIAEPAPDFQRWIERQRRPRGGPTSERLAFGQLVFERSACAGCHTIQGTSATGTAGPDLSDFGGRQTIGALAVPNNRGNLAGWIADSQSIKPGNLMPPVQLSSEELLAVVEYLESQR